MLSMLVLRGLLKKRLFQQRCVIILVFALHFQENTVRGVLCIHHSMIKKWSKARLQKLVKILLKKQNFIKILVS